MDTFSVRQYRPEDYGMLVEWWRGHDWPALPVDHLPRVGVVVGRGSKPICVGFLYQTDSAFSWVEWVTADPGSNKTERRQALDCLIKEITAASDRLGFKTCFSGTAHIRLVESYKKNGWTVTDRAVTHMIRSKENT